jgi:hypothetical protein
MCLAIKKLIQTRFLCRFPEQLCDGGEGVARPAGSRPLVAAAHNQRTRPLAHGRTRPLPALAHGTPASVHLASCRPREAPGFLIQEKVKTRVADTHHFNADPDPTSLQKDGNHLSNVYRPSPGLHFEPPGLHCERPRPSMALFCASKASQF